MKPGLAPVTRRPLARLSAYDLHWAARWHRLDALTGQPGTGTFVTANPLIGSDGTSLAALAGMPRWQMQDVEAGVSGRETATLLLGTSDSLSWDLAVRAALPWTLLLEFLQPGSFPGAGTVLGYLGNDAVTGARLLVDSTGSQYRATYHNGSASVSSTFAGTAPTAGEYVQLRVTRDASGRVQLHQARAFGAEVSAAQSAPLTLADYGTTTRLRLNGLGTTGNRTTFAAIRAVGLGASATLAELLRF